LQVWTLLSVLAALLQTIRFVLQKQLRAGRLSTGGATFARFLFAAPLAAALALAVLWAEGRALPGMPARFWAFACAGGLAQILATMATVALFAERNFAVGIAFTKTETVQVALFSAVVLGEAVSGVALAAIVAGFAGVVALSVTPAALGRARFLNRASGLGLLAGGLFGASAIGYRGAALALADGGVFLRAAVTLACVTAFQTLAMTLWLRLREPGQIGAVARGWRRTGLVGVTGMLGSLCWFTAFTLMNAAYVRAVGQVEIVFTLLASWLVFGERIAARELAGIALVVASLVVLVVWG
jgi:drug/metabolite transporter (DMT)-like permease